MLWPWESPAYGSSKEEKVVDTYFDEVLVLEADDHLHKITRVDKSEGGAISVIQQLESTSAELKLVFIDF